MKYTNVKAFEKHLLDAYPKNFADVYAVIGKESYEVKAAVDELVNILLKTLKDPKFALKTYDGQKLVIQEVMQELNSLPFFSEKRVVLIFNAEELNKADIAKLEEYFAHPNETLTLIISASAINRATNFYKKMEKVGVLLDFAEEKQWEKEKSSKEWIFVKVAKENKRISEAAAHLLQKQIGTDLSSLNQEIEKLICFIGDRNEITQDDVAAICTLLHTETGWQLGEAIFARNGSSAFRITKGLLESGVPFLALIRQIRSQVQTGFQICTILASGGLAADITSEFPFMRGRILDNNMQSATNYGLARFKKAMLKIDETESAAKNGLGSDEYLSDLLIAHLVM